ncbi:MAG: sensor domain-containing diguanylate cyclase, partial [Spirochaetaceae bacterium]
IWYQIHLSESIPHDFTVIGLMLSAVVIFLVFGRYGTNRIIPVARSFLVEYLRDPIAVVNSSGRILDRNLRFNRIFGSPEKNTYIQQIMPSWTSIIARMEKAHTLHTMQFNQNERIRWMEAGISRLPRRRSSVYAIAFRDVSQHINDQEQLKDAIAARDKHIKTAEDLKEQLHEQAVRDELTGLYNRRFWAESIERECARVQRRNCELSIAMIDIDHFKLLNDTYGHKLGDAVLKHITKLISKHSRQSDIFFRFGGEEFVLVMPEIGNESAMERLEEMRLMIQNTPYEHAEHGPLSITISIGYAVIPRHGSDHEKILETADQAMYYAKEHGRNKTVSADIFMP